MAKFLTSIFGSRNQRLLRQYSKVVKKINALEEGVQALDDAALKAKTEELRKRYDSGETLDALLPEAFAVAREAAVRTLHMRPFDVQLIGGMVLHDGNIDLSGQFFPSSTQTTKFRFGKVEKHLQPFLPLPKQFCSMDQN